VSPVLASEHGNVQVGPIPWGDEWRSRGKPWGGTDGAMSFSRVVGRLQAGRQAGTGAGTTIKQGGRQRRRQSDNAGRQVATARHYRQAASYLRQPSTSREQLQAATQRDDDNTCCPFERLAISVFCGCIRRTTPKRGRLAMARCGNLRLGSASLRSSKVHPHRAAPRAHPFPQAYMY
jgi:hypothetical protein